MAIPEIRLLTSSLFVRWQSRAAMNLSTLLMLGMDVSVCDRWVARWSPLLCRALTCLPVLLGIILVLTVSRTPVSCSLVLVTVVLSEDALIFVLLITVVRVYLVSALVADGLVKYLVRVLSIAFLMRLPVMCYLRLLFIGMSQQRQCSFAFDALVAFSNGPFARVL